MPTNTLKPEPFYVRREWLNDLDSSFTGSAAGCIGADWYENGEWRISAFFEVADCRTKVRLHGGVTDPCDRAAFARKMRLLAEMALELADACERYVPI